MCLLFSVIIWLVLIWVIFVLIWLCLLCSVDRCVFGLDLVCVVSCESCLMISVRWFLVVVMWVCLRLLVKWIVCSVVVDSLYCFWLVFLGRWCFS